MERLPTVASFFSGCGGFDLGFKKAGFKIVLANDNWRPAAETYKKNNPEVPFIFGNIEDIRKSVLKEISSNSGGIDVVIGGPPCQCFTRLNNNNLRSDDRRNMLFKEYLRIVNILRPKFVLMENVSDLLMRKDSNGIQFTKLIYKEFKKNGYELNHGILEADKFGVPQKRKRVFFLASNLKIKLSFPEPTNRTQNVGEALKKLKNKKFLLNNQKAKNTPKLKKMISYIPQGGYYEHLPKRLKVKKIRNGELIVVKRYGTYLRRLSLKEPAFTISKNSIIHPTKNRYLTNRESAILHTFPIRYEFIGGSGDTAQMIGNAVPPRLSRHLALHIKDMLKHNSFENESNTYFMPRNDQEIVCHA